MTAKAKKIRDWLSLPSDITANILKRIGVVDILENAQKVCTSWRRVCKDPAMWRVIKMNNLSSFVQVLMCKQAVDRSQCQLVDISLRSCDDELLSYVANRSRELIRLEIVLCRRISDIPLMKFQHLEELNLYLIKVSIKKTFIEFAGRYCPMLKTLKVNRKPCKRRYGDANELAIAIGENLHELRHLELIGNNMLNTGLQAILDGCPCLETLDLRKCLHIDLSGDMGKRCLEQITSLKMPNDSLEGSPHSDIYEEELRLDNNDSYGADDAEDFDGYISQ